MQADDFERAVAQHYPELLRFARSRLRRNRAEAEDAVQQTLAELVEVYPEFEPVDPGHVIKWMMTALKFRVVDRVRERRLTVPNPEKYAAHEPSPGDVDYVQVLDRAQRLLPADWFKDLVSHIETDASLRDLARQRGIAWTSYRRQWQRHMQRLGGALG